MIRIETNKNEGTITTIGTPWDIQAELQVSVVKDLQGLSEKDGLPLQAHLDMFIIGLKYAVKLEESKGSE